GTAEKNLRPVLKEEVPSGIYKAKSPGNVCPTISQLTNFEVATVKAAVNGTLVPMKAANRLVWYGRSMTQDIKSNFDLEAFDVVDDEKKCFRFVGNSGDAAMSAAGEFIQDLYHRSGQFVPTQPHSDLAFCKTFSGLMVGLGIVRKDDHRFKDFKNIVELEGPETPEVPSEADVVDPWPTPPSASDKKKLPELPYQPAVKDDLLTGVYTPVKPAEVCRTIPQLTDFKVKVWESDGELVALAEANVGKKPVLMTAPNRLAWYSKSRAYKIDLKPHGLNVKKCFRFVAQTQHGMSEAGRFVKDLYGRLGKPKLKQPVSNIGFCRTTEGLM
ncbi:hypothetical protein FOZ61_003106, partial [Perkinsus olseni]